MIGPPIDASRTIQRLMLATTSFASTGSPSWNFRPGRSLNVQVLKSLRVFVRFDHLRLRLQLVVHAEQHVPDQQRAVADDVLRGPDRIEVGEVGLRHEAQNLVVGGQRQPRRRQRTCHYGCSLQEAPAIDPVCHLPIPAARRPRTIAACLTAGWNAIEGVVYIFRGNTAAKDRPRALLDRLYDLEALELWVTQI